MPKLDPMGMVAGENRRDVSRLLVSLLVLMFLAGGLTACGKRGDPYRPSEVPAEKPSY